MKLKTTLNGHPVLVEYIRDEKWEEFVPTEVYYNDVDVLPVLHDSQFEELKAEVSIKGYDNEDI